MFCRVLDYLLRDLCHSFWGLVWGRWGLDNRAGLDSKDSNDMKCTESTLRELLNDDFLINLNLGTSRPV